MCGEPRHPNPKKRERDGFARGTLKRGRITRAGTRKGVGYVEYSGEEGKYSGDFPGTAGVA